MSIQFGSLDPNLSLRIEEYGLSKLYVSLIFGIQPFFEMLGSFSLPYIVPSWIEHRVTMITFLLILGLSNFLIGPFYGGLDLPVMLTGLVLSGIALGPLVIPNMAEMMNATAQKYPDADLDHASSLLSGILNSCMGLGMAAGPILGGLLFEATNFNLMNTIIGGFLVLMALLYFVCAGGFEAFRQTCINFRNRNRKESESTVGNEGPRPSSLMPIKAGSAVLLHLSGSLSNR